MRIIAAYLLAVLGGNKSPKADDINKILSSVGITGDKAKIDKLIKELDGKDLEELIAEGQKKLAMVPSGGGGGGGGAKAGGSGGDAKPAEAAAPEPEEESEEDEEMGFDLFD